MRIYLGDLYYDQHRPKGPVPLNAAYVAAYCAETLGKSVDITLFKSPGDLLDAIDTAPPDVLGLSNYIWNERLSAFVADYAKSIKPQTLVLMGGPNIRLDRDGMAAFLRRYRQVDYYIPYAAEQPTSRLLTAISARDPADRQRGLEVSGCLTLDCDDLLVGKEDIDPRTELDYLPSPYLTGWLDPFLRAGYTPLFETNRGCPYHCTFCVWGISALSKVKRFSDARVHAELNHAAASSVPVPLWRLADANFGILKRDAEIAQKIRDIHDARPELFGYVDVWWAKNPTQTMVDVARALGNLTMGYVAFQSLDEDVLANIKRSNISTGRLTEFIGQIAPYVDGLHTDLLVGLPGESKSSHLQSYRKALEIGFTSIGGGEIRMLPGSEMDTPESRTRYGLRTKWRISEGDVGVWRGQHVFELEEGIRGSDVMSEQDMLELRAIRAVLYGCITLGYLGPLVSAMRVLKRDLVGLLTQVVDRAQAGGALAKILDSLKAMARDEWFATEDEAHRHLSQDSVRRHLIETPPTKLNLWFIAALVLQPTAADEFFSSVEASLIADGLAPEMAADLVRLSRATDVLGPATRGEAVTEREVAIGIETASVLTAAGWLSAGSSRPVRLKMPPERLAAFQAWINERKPLSIFDATLAFGEFSALNLRPVRPKEQVAA